MARCRQDLKGRLAVVTGASSGIGLCFARTLAGRGCDLVLISNQREALEQTAADTAATYGVKATPLYCDLTAPDAAEEVLAFLDGRGLEADILINNAGVFSFMPATEMSDRKTDVFIDLHVRAVTSLSRAFGRRMAAKGRGNILNMSSMSCWTPMPGIAMYAATKAYIRVFSRALHYELRDAGVRVTVACPGGIATDLFGLPDRLKRLALRLHAIQTPEKFTRHAVDRMLRGRMQYINGWLNRIGIVAVGVAPTWLRMQVKRRMLDQNITRP